MKNKPVEETKELVPQESSAVPAMVQAIFRGHEEENEPDDFQMPRAALVQFTSEAAQAENKEDRIDPGTMINSLTKEKLPDVFVPIFKFTTFTQWNARKKDDPNFDQAFEPGERVFTTSDRRDPRVIEGIKWGANNEPPKVTKTMNFLCYFVGHEYPLVLSFSKTSLTAGKTLNTLTQSGEMFKKKFRVRVKQKSSAGTQFFVLDITPAGLSTPEEYKIAEQWYTQFREKTIEVHAEKTDDKPWAE